ncbi:MAG: transposase [Prosthecobacter sp.]|nr:transposase [Prosthecobacter sp.]
MEFRFFDPSAKVEVSRRNLPHWEQGDAYYFLTWRTADSIPTEVAEEWHRERAEWLLGHGINPELDDWQREVELLPEVAHREFYQRFTTRWHELLDDCHGQCVLRQPELSEVVAENLRRFDGERYELEGFVVMPNHVHVLAGIPGRGAMKRLCRNWKGFTAKRINKRLGREGQFWQWESFDHLVRSPSSFEKFRRYIAENPRKAGLRDGECRVWVKSPSRK